MRTQLASALAEALHLPDSEASPDEVVQDETLYDEVTPRFSRGQLDAARGQVF